MSLLYRDNSGTETPVAGLNGTSGELVPSVALVQSGTYTPSSAVQAQEDIAFSITFTTPMPDADYLVDWWYGPSLSGVLQVAIRTRTTTGFSGVFRNVGTASLPAHNCAFNWTAFKLMTDTVHEADSAHIAQNTANFAPAFSEVTSYAVGDYCTYNNVLYRCTTAHTAGTWVAGHFTVVTVGDSIARYNYELSLPGYYSNDVLIAIKATADAVGNYKMFQGDTQAGAEAAWFGLKKTSDYWHCTIWDGHGVVAHLVYKNGTYTANVIHEGVPNQ